MDHAKIVVSSMQIIMSSILNEEDDILMPLLTILFAYVRKEKQEVSPIAETLAQSIVDQCQEKLRPYLTDEELAGPAVHVQQKTVKEEDPLDEEQGKSSSLVESISLSSNICMPSEVTEKGIMKEEQKDNSDLHMVKSSLGNEAPKKDDDFQFKKLANVAPKGKHFDLLYPHHILSSPYLVTYEYDANKKVKENGALLDGNCKKKGAEILSYEEFMGSMYGGKTHDIIPRYEGLHTSPFHLCHLYDIHLKIDDKGRVHWHLLGQRVGKNKHVHNLVPYGLPCYKYDPTRAAFDWIRVVH
ncbi:hypothetical protein KI387_000876, partial [Taxus chinensis]